MSKNENVLVIPRSEFEKRGAFSGFRKMDDAHNIGQYLTCHPDEKCLATFIPREEAETSEEFIQIIPYFVLICGNSVFRYSRNDKGGETRLHNHISIGVGGHINDEAGHEEHIHTYIDSSLRELREEVGLELPPQAIANTAVGMVHDPDSAVGRVHLGVIHFISIPPDKIQDVIKGAEESMSDPMFSEVKSLMECEGDELETWSRWALEEIIRVHEMKKPWEDEDVLKNVRLLSIASAELARAAGELAMQSVGRNWMVGSHNVTNAAGAVLAMLERLFESNSINRESVEFIKNSELKANG